MQMPICDWAVQTLYRPDSFPELARSGVVLASRDQTSVVFRGKTSNQEQYPVTAFLIANIKVTNDKWVPEYAASVHDIVHKHGGKYLSRSGNVKTLEGKPLDTTFIALLEFPSAEAVKAFATDPKYAPYAAARQAGSESRFQLIDDTDVAGTIPYLPKG